MTDNLEYSKEQVDVKLKRSSITKRLFRKHHYTQTAVKSRFLRRNRHAPKKNNQIDLINNVVHEDSQS